MLKETLRASVIKETIELIPQNNYHFKRTLTRNFVKKNGIKGIYEIIDVLIVASAPPTNPMTKAGLELWSWGILTINGILLPAPYLEREYTANGLLVDLTEEYIAVTNTYFWLETLLSFWHMPKDRILILAGSNLDLGFKWIDTVGEKKIQEILTVLRMKASDNPNGRLILDWAFRGSLLR